MIFRVRLTANGKPSSNNNTNVNNFDAKTATNKQKGNYGEIKSSDNLLNNQSLKEAGFNATNEKGGCE
ncbi:hypothetical protein PDR34_04475 [Bacillus cereus]|nr:hypothetical protein [Bacillus cereus]